MEFIPLERYSEDFEKKRFVEKQGARKINKIKKSETVEKVTVKKAKSKPLAKVSLKKNFKNKCNKEGVALKSKKGVLSKCRLKEEVKADKSKCKKDEVKEEVKEEENNGVGHFYKSYTKEELFKMKCKEMDEKKKNRLFLKLKKKISSEAEIRDLHPEIKGVIFPRKKNTRWCWAVFESQERANEAFEDLVKNYDVIVGKPNPYERVIMKMKQRKERILKRKEAKKKLQNMWT